MLIISACKSTSSPTDDQLLQIVQPSTISANEIEITIEANSTDMPSPTPTLPYLPGNAKLIDSEEYALEFTFEDVALDVASPQMLLIDIESRRSLEVGNRIAVDMIDWEGNRQQLFSVLYRGREGIGRATSIYVSPITVATNWIIMDLRIAYQASEFYLVNLDTYDIWAFEDGCVEQSLHPAIGVNDIAVGCLEEPRIWHFLSIEGAGEGHELELITESNTSFSYPPVMFEDFALFLEDVNQVACTVDFQIWEPVCKEFILWLGSISADGEWIEVRYEYDFDPEMVGVMEAGCLLLDETVCEPLLMPLASELPISQDRWYLGESAWLPDSSGILYMVELETDGSNNETDEREIWTFDIPTRQFRFLGRYNLPLRFGDNHPITNENPPPWSPDGSSVVMSVGEQYYLFNVETAELTPLTEGGILLGAITLP